MTKNETRQGGTDPEEKAPELSEEAKQERRKYYRDYYKTHRDQIAENQKRYMKKYRKTSKYRASQARYWEKRAKRENIAPEAQEKE